MLTLHDAGAIICPPMPSFYLKPVDLEAMARQFATRICDQIGIYLPDIPRWQGIISIINLKPDVP